MAHLLQPVTIILHLIAVQGLLKTMFKNELELERTRINYELEKLLKN